MTYRLSIVALLALTLLAIPLYAEEEMQLPPQTGIGVTFYTQQQSYDLAGGSVFLMGVPVPLGLLPDVDIDSDLYEVNLKLDTWVLPFLNVFVLGGYVDGDTAISALLPPDVVAALGGDPALAALAGPVTLDIEYDGYVYGAGATLAGGWEDLFGSLTATYTVTDLDISDAEITTWVLTPKFGVTLEGSGSIGTVACWIGGMYQDVEEDQAGDIVLSALGRVDYDVELEEKDSWNTLAGISIEINDSWTIELENGIGDRQHALVTATYRF